MIDTTDGTITLPWTATPSPNPNAEALHASAIAMHQCAADRVRHRRQSEMFLTPSTSRPER